MWRLAMHREEGIAGLAADATVDSGRPKTVLRAPTAPVIGLQGREI